MALKFTADSSQVDEEKNCNADNSGEVKFGSWEIGAKIKINIKVERLKRWQKLCHYNATALLEDAKRNHELQMEAQLAGATEHANQVTQTRLNGNWTSK